MDTQDFLNLCIAGLVVLIGLLGLLMMGAIIFDVIVRKTKHDSDVAPGIFVGGLVLFVASMVILGVMTDYQHDLDQESTQKVTEATATK